MSLTLLFDMVIRKRESDPIPQRRSRLSDSANDARSHDPQPITPEPDDLSVHPRTTSRFNRSSVGHVNPTAGVDGGHDPANATNWRALRATYTHERFNIKGERAPLSSVVYVASLVGYLAGGLRGDANELLGLEPGTA